MGTSIGILTSAAIAELDHRMISPAHKFGGSLDDFMGVCKVKKLLPEVCCAFIELTGPMYTFEYYNGREISGMGVAEVGEEVEFYSHAWQVLITTRIKSVSWSGSIAGRQWRAQIQLQSPAYVSDTGAVVLRKGTNEALGMIFAVAEGKALANHMYAILNTLGASLAVREGSTPQKQVVEEPLPIHRNQYTHQVHISIIGTWKTFTPRCFFSKFPI